MEKSNGLPATERCYYLGFSYFRKIGPMAWRRLENYFSSLAAAWSADRGELIKTGLSEKVSAEFIAWRKRQNLPALAAGLEKAGINYITWREAAYPSALSEIAAAPPVLYHRGPLTDVSVRRSLAVVGSRRADFYAEKTVNKLLPPLVKAGITIISGLAQGVDSLAHQAALNVGGRTWAVLGSGLVAGQIYPATNRRLAENILNRGGALISEFPPGTPPYRQNFPQRNRIIAGLARATLVIEARAKSGALITANYALEQNREVLAVPGSIFSEFSAGPNNLIKAGAMAVTEPADLLALFECPVPAADHPANSSDHYQSDSPQETLIYQLIKRASERNERLGADEIIRRSRLDTATVNSILSILEIKGIAKNTESGYDLN